ncbi:carbohydrate ABC transporter permease [Allosalinactinospora lopnorensis]|uniref:carbohydrate ABC transporter permease n=1 Tax=Allosalinactinospora lopnorensis TaxID=1352348 RepID=UPI000623BA54|nr:carbohydrate ABC transporter permease [Allosalinactinospora lopnorensis]
MPNLGVAAIVLFCLTPFYWMVATTLRPPNQQFDNSLIPRSVSPENLIAVFDPSVGFHRALLNSFLVAGITTALTLVIGTTTAYALARLTFRGKKIVLAAIIATVMFPGISLIVPLLKLFTDIGWINTYQAMIVPYLSFALPLTVWLLTTFFKQMPFDLEQAAQADGCTPGQAFRKVILPIALPGMFTAAVLTFIMAWNEFIIALTIVNRPKMQTVTVAISQFTGAQQFELPFGTQMAAGVVVTIPLVLLVLICRRRIIAGLTAGGVK